MQHDFQGVFPPSPVGIATVEGQRMWERSLPALWEAYYAAVRSVYGDGSGGSRARVPGGTAGGSCGNSDRPYGARKRRRSSGVPEWKKRRNWRGRDDGESTCDAVQASAVHVGSVLSTSGGGDVAFFGDGCGGTEGAVFCAESGVCGIDAVHPVAGCRGVGGGEYSFGQAEVAEEVSKVVADGQVFGGGSRAPLAVYSAGVDHSVGVTGGPGSVSLSVVSYCLSGLFLLLDLTEEEKRILTLVKYVEKRIEDGTFCLADAQMIERSGVFG